MVRDMRRDPELEKEMGLVWALILVTALCCPIIIIQII